MAATLGCNTAHVLYNAPVAGNRTVGEPSTSSIFRLPLRRRRGDGGSKKLSLKLSGRRVVNVGPLLARASLPSEGDKIVELASEKAVESGQQFEQDAKKLSNGHSPAELDAQVDDASDAASLDNNVREKAVDVASDMAVDSSEDVDALAKKDAEPFAAEYGRSIEEAAEGLETKAAEISEREAKKESGTTLESRADSAPFFKDQVIKEKVLDVASSSAIDEGPEVQETAQRDASDMTNKVGGDLRRNKVTIVGMADAASKLEGDRSGSDRSGVTKEAKEKTNEVRQNIGGQLEGLSRTISKNLKEGIDSSRPTIEELSRKAEEGVKAGRENLDYAAEGASELSGDAREALDGAKGVLDKRLKVINLAAEEARETGSMVAELAAKGWDALTKTTERIVDNFQKNIGDAKETAQEKTREAQQKAQETAEQAQRTFGEVKENVEAKSAELTETAQEKAKLARQKAEESVSNAQSKFDEVKGDVQTRATEFKDTAQEKASEARQRAEETADKAQDKASEVKDNVQSKTGELKVAAQEKSEEAARRAEDTTESAKSKAGELKDTAQEKAGEAKQSAKETADRARDQFDETKDTVQSKTDELKNTAQEKASESKAKLEDTAVEAKTKTEELSASAKQRAGNAQQDVESKAGQAKDAGSSVVDSGEKSISNVANKMNGNGNHESSTTATGTAVGSTPGWDSVQKTGSTNGNNSESKSHVESAVGKTPGSEASARYEDSGKVNDEWKGKSN